MQMESEFYDIDEESAKRLLRRKLIPLNLCKIPRPKGRKGQFCSFICATRADIV
jgi:hypothetical protein